MRFRNVIIIFAFILQIPLVFASNLKLGKYEGMTPEGQKCEMYLEKIFFEFDVKHPISERMAVKYSDQIFHIGHPVIVDKITSKIKIEHSILQGFLPLKQNKHFAQGFFMFVEGKGESFRPSGFEVLNSGCMNEDLVCKKIKCNNIKFMDSLIKDDAK